MRRHRHMMQLLNAAKTEKKSLCALTGKKSLCAWRSSAMLNIPLSCIVSACNRVPCTTFARSDRPTDSRPCLTVPLTLQQEEGLTRRRSRRSTRSSRPSQPSTFQARSIAEQIHFLACIMCASAAFHLLPPVGVRQASTLQVSGGKTYTFIQKLGSGRFWSLSDLLVSHLVSIAFYACLVSWLFGCSIG